MLTLPRPQLRNLVGAEVAYLRVSQRRHDRQARRSQKQTVTEPDQKACIATPSLLR